MAEVVGFRDKRLLLMPYESVEGIGVGCIVENTGHPLSVPVGNELLGHTLDGIGRPTDIDKLETPYEYPVDAQPPDPMSRKIISEAVSYTHLADKTKKYKLYLEEYYAEKLETLSNVDAAAVTLDLPDEDGTILSKGEQAYVTAILTLNGTCLLYTSRCV